ncbi:myb family transcription factor PHL5-like isoform X2 [Panicum virgatum]|nr:myb family transcription factor PHL5-like isoform X2 [Panicum virgatum]
MTLNYPQMAESTHVSSPLNSETWQLEHIVHQLVSVPTIPGQLYPTVSPPATINVHSPQRTKVRRRWTTEMHDRFIDAVNQLGGCENAKPKAILDIMNVEGLTRDQVKSHLQKYKLAQVRHRSSEVGGTLVGTTTSNEAIPSDVQIRIKKFALQVKIELQKKLHEMVERTRHDLLEIHRSILENHVMSLHELEEQQILNTDGRTVHLLPSPPAAAAAAPPPVALSRMTGQGSRAAASAEDAQASEAGSLGNNAVA